MEILRWSKIAGKAAFHAGRDTKTAARPLPDHGHDFAEIFWIDAGQGTHRINGASLPLRAGSLVLMRPSDCHGMVTGPREELRLTNVAFPRETLEFLRHRYFPGPNWAFSPLGKYPVTRQVEPSQLSRFNHWADELSRSPRERLYLERFLLNILAELSLEQNEALVLDAPEWLLQACRAIRKPEHFSRGTSEFLRLCGRSREHVARSVRRHLGTTPTDYVNGVRMAYAKRQLEMGDRGILDIGFDCGMENMSHFYARFRTATGTTPRKYRLVHRKPL